MSIWKRYPLFCSSLIVIALFASTFFWTRIPTEGYLTSTDSVVSFRFGYVVEQEQPPDIDDVMKRAGANTFFAAPDRLYASDRPIPNSFFYPIYDDTSAQAAFAERYPYLPGDAVPGYGGSVYSIDYGNARFLFLRGERLENPADPQWRWLTETITANPQVHTILFTYHQPKNPRFWQTLRQLQVDLVLVRGEAYVLDQLVAEQSSEYQRSSYPGWGKWDAAQQFSQPHVWMLAGEEDRLSIQVTEPSGELLDTLEVDVGRREEAQPRTEKVLVGVQSDWRYHLGTRSIKAVIPAGFDVTGEQPITQPFALPPDDWRSSGYDDSSWEEGRAVLGHSNREKESATLQTVLPASEESPSYYFRKSFTLDEDPAVVRDLILRLTYEDGVIVYLNGEEVARDGLRSGLIIYSSLADPNEPQLYRFYSLKNHISKLRKGANTLAVEVHRSHPMSPNLLFDLQLSYQN